jgi:hypothetical protein
MAWIRVDQSLGHHRKTRRLARELGIDRAAAVGHLVLLWSWALDNAPGGILTGIDAQDIADAAQYHANDTGENRGSVTFLEALVAGGFVDRRGHGKGRPAEYRIHDWYEYAGRLCETRAANRERMRLARAGATKSTKSRVENEDNDLPPYSPPKGGRRRKRRDPDEPLSGRFREQVKH